MNALDLLYIPLALATAPWWARKQRSGWSERFGRIAPLAPDRAAAPSGHKRPTILLHAVSVGEVNALRELVPLLIDEARVIVSIGTDTGIKRARELFAGDRPLCDVVRYPLDASWAVRRFLDTTRPDAVALVELEIWPNFVRECRRRNTPVCIINGRLSERSFRGYRRLRRFFRPLFASLQFAAVQDQDYAARFEHMGVDPGRCLITGSMKWDAGRTRDSVPGADDLARALGIDRSRPLIVAGSTAEDEEALLHRACPPGAQLLCAPRKPERAGEAAAAMPGCTRRLQDRTTSAKTTIAGTPGSGRFLLATIGELAMAYSLADLVVLGRSFGTLYGSDPVEPIGLGKATVIGPAISDFAQVVAEFERGGGIVRATRGSLGPVLEELLASPERRRQLGERGRAVIREQQGASARHAELVLSMMTTRSPSGRTTLASVG